MKNSECIIYIMFKDKMAAEVQKRKGWLEGIQSVMELFVNALQNNLFPIYFRL